MAGIEIHDIASKGKVSSKAEWLLRAIAHRFAGVVAGIAVVRDVVVPNPSTSFQGEKDKVIRTIARNDPISLTML